MTMESAKQILAQLPGVDCGGFGGCGYPTCEACAQAIAEGAPITLCPAAKTEAVAEIAKIMGVEPVAVEAKIAFIKCAGCSAGKDRFKAEACESCDAARKAGFAKDECQYGCIGLGTCIERCKFDAMKLEDGEIVIDKEKCSGCEACLSGCIQEIIEMVPADATNFIPCSSKADEKETLAVCGYGCIGCADCALACPKDAIEMVQGDKVDGRFARIDYDKCEGCVTCAVKCRKKIIVDTLHDLTKAKETVALVRCSGGSIGHQKLEAAGYDSCKAIVDAKLDLDGMDVCEYGCLGFGDCTKVCRYDAIKNEYGIAKVDPEKCVGCGDCFRACPKNKIQMVPYIGVKQAACESEADPERRMEVCFMGCIGCGDCADNCPNGAIEMVDGHPEIDHDKCLNCGVCKYVCSRDLIAEREVPEYNYLQREALEIDN
ncbi:MAG: 4Fe-4S dicluster domain-containing protein [Clostridia bacterium]|nr:4Fe-4S dicluster domain-containing protein [Clostridia bacterium]